MRIGGRTDGQTRRDEAYSRLSQLLRSLLELKDYHTAGTLSLYFNAKLIITLSAPLSHTTSKMSIDRPRDTYEINVSTEIDCQLKFSV